MFDVIKRLLGKPTNPASIDDIIANEYAELMLLKRECQLVKVYIDPLVSISDFPLLVRPDKNSKILYELHFCNQGQHCMPLHDYEYLVYGARSLLYEEFKFNHAAYESFEFDHNSNDKKLVEFSNAVEKKTPIVILSGDYYSSSSAGGTKQHYPFLDFLKSKIDFDYDWHPDSGKELGKSTDPFKLWWNYVNSYNVSFKNLPNGSEILARNKANMPIAWRYENFIFIPSKRCDFLNTSYGYPICDERGVRREHGPFNVEKRYELVKTLVSFLHEFHPIEAEPGWIAGIPVLNEPDLLKNRDEIRAQLAHLQEIKKILYTSGTELERSFAVILNDISIGLTKIGTSDYVLSTDPPIIVEITGIKHNIKKDKATQLLGHFEELKDKIKDGVHAKKLFFVNYQKDLPPAKRERLDAYVLKEFYAKNNICVLTSQTLLQFYEQIKNEVITKDEFINKLLSTDGEI